VFGDARWDFERIGSHDHLDRWIYVLVDSGYPLREPGDHVLVRIKHDWAQDNRLTRNPGNRIRGNGVEARDDPAPQARHEGRDPIGHASGGSDDDV